MDEEREGARGGRQYPYHTMQRDKPTTEERERERRENRQMSRRRTGRETTSKAKVCEEAASVDSINVCLCRVFRRTDDVHSEVSTPEQQRLHEPREMWSKTTDREYYGDQNEEEAGSIFLFFFWALP